VFVYFCRGLSGNTEERPTRRVYIEILTCCAIFYHLEDSRSHGNEAEAERAQAQGSWGRPPCYSAQSESNSWTMLHRPKGSRKTVWSMLVWSNGPDSLEGTIKPDPLAPGDHTSSTESKLGFQFFIQVERIPLVLLVLPLVHLVQVLVHLVLVPLVLVLVSSSCNLENWEREEESGGGARSVGSSSTLYFCTNWFVLHRSPGSSIHNSWVL